MGNYGVKLRKPEELPDFDQPIDYEEEKKRFEPVKVEEQNDKESHKDYSQPSYQETELSQRKGLLLPKRIINEWEKQGTGSNYPSFRGNTSNRFVSATVKPCMSRRKPKGDLTMWCGRLASREQAFQDMWSRCFENISTNTKMMWKDGGNSEVPHSSNASLR